MVLATVYDTVGSTYSKAGQRILIRANSDYQGLVSGGCLEGDLAERAKSVLESGEPAPVTYDMRDEADDIFGLGVGCNGMIRVFLQRLTLDDAYEPFSSIAKLLLSGKSWGVATVIRGDTDLVSGTTVVWDGSSAALNSVSGSASERLFAGCEAALAAGRAVYEIDDDGLEVLYSPLRPVPNLLVLGAGLDSVPVVGIAAELGWRISVADHRPAYLDNNQFAGAERVVLVDPSALRREIAVEEFDAVIVMSHHLLSDQAYLSQVVDCDIPYIGVLGPHARKERLLNALGEKGKQLAPVLKGPVGLDIGADSPESIALSLVAEIHAVLKANEGRRSTQS